MKVATRSFYLIFLLLTLGFTTSAQAQFVGSAKSTKFHKESCQHAKRIAEENLIEFASVKAAEDAGYVPCKTCRPSGKTVRPKDHPSDKSVSGDGRCMATTRKGTRCKRKAQESSKYCWQHNK